MNLLASVGFGDAIVLGVVAAMIAMLLLATKIVKRREEAARAKRGGQNPIPVPVPTDPPDNNWKNKESVPWPVCISRRRAANFL